MQDFRKLAAWQKAHLLVLEVYDVTTAFPSHERYGLTSQIRRAAGSVTANIAEGCGRETTPDLARFISIATGSLTEVRSHLKLASDLGYLQMAAFEELDSKAEEVRRMLAGLLRALKSTRPAQSL